MTVWYNATEDIIGILKEPGRLEFQFGWRRGILEIYFHRFNKKHSTYTELLHQSAEFWEYVGEFE